MRWRFSSWNFPEESLHQRIPVILNEHFATLLLSCHFDVLSQATNFSRNYKCKNVTKDKGYLRKNGQIFAKDGRVLNIRQRNICRAYRRQTTVLRGEREKWKVRRAERRRPLRFARCKWTRKLNLVACDDRKRQRARLKPREEISSSHGTPRNYSWNFRETPSNFRSSVSFYFLSLEAFQSTAKLNIKPSDVTNEMMLRVTMLVARPVM